MTVTPTKRFISLALGLVGIVLSLGACGSDGGSGDGGRDKLIMISGPAGEPLYYTIEQSARAEAERLGVDLEIQQPPNFEASTQVPLLEAAVAKSPDAIMIVPSDGKVLQPSAERAVERGIPVITFDTTFEDESLPATYVSVDPEKLGVTGAELLSREIDDKGKVFYAGVSPPGVSSFMDGLRAGWESVMSDKPNIEEAEVTYSEFEPSKASQQMQGTLNGNPDLVGGWLGTPYDVTGIIPVLKRAGKLDSLVKVALDGSPANVERLESGELDYIVGYKGREYGTEAVKAAVAAIAGEELPAFTEIDQCTITPDNVDESQDCIYEQP
jgi:ribose transport system substrate-binding protein